VSSRRGRPRPRPFANFIKTFLFFVKRHNWL
jgi:hypothetical protein